MLADVGAQPASPQTGLVRAESSDDHAPPRSTITAPAPGATVPAGQPLTVTGTASDDGGQVGGVEISTDGGATWHPAVGRSSWSYTFVPETPGPLDIRVQATDDSLNTERPGSAVSLGVGARECPCTVLGLSAEPTSPRWDEGGPVTLGMRFRADRAGVVRGVRFYKAIGESGTHTGRLWTADGRLLATTTFTAETPSGWQQASFATPVAITPGETFVVSYHSPGGRYAGDHDVFAHQGIDHPPLHAPASTAAAPNGLYIDGADAFPTSSFRDSSYYVDVLFE
jgi:hypothetical protein